MRNLIDRRETAKYLNVSLSTLDRWRHSGKLPSVILGRSVRFDIDVLRAIIQASLDEQIKTMKTW